MKETKLVPILSPICVIVLGAFVAYFTHSGWRIAYSTALFVLSHPLMWGMFSIANRSWMTMVSLVIMGIVWSLVYLKTKSLRWC